MFASTCAKENGPLGPLGREYANVMDPVERLIWYTCAHEEKSLEKETRKCGSDVLE